MELNLNCPQQYPAQLHWLSSFGRQDVPSWSRDSSFRIYLSPRVVSPEIMPFLRCPHMVTSWDDSTKAWPFWPHAGWCRWPIYALVSCQAGQGSVRPASRCDYPILLPLPFIHRYWSLRNTLYPQICLEPASRKNNYNTVSHLSSNSSLAPRTTDKPRALKPVSVWRGLKLQPEEKRRMALPCS